MLVEDGRNGQRRARMAGLGGDDLRGRREGDDGYIEQLSSIRPVTATVPHFRYCTVRRGWW